MFVRNGLWTWHCPCVQNRTANPYYFGFLHGEGYKQPDGWSGFGALWAFGAYEGIPNRIKIAASKTTSAMKTMVAIRLLGNIGCSIGLSGAFMGFGAYFGLFGLSVAFRNVKLKAIMNRHKVAITRVNGSMRPLTVSIPSDKRVVSMM